MTLINADLARRLGASGRSDPLSLKWTNGITQQDRASERVNLTIRTRSAASFVLTNVRTRQGLTLAAPPVDLEMVKSKWGHLQSIDLSKCNGSPPQLLIGQDHGHLTVAREVIEGPPNAPMASRNKLGWVIHGSLCGQLRNRVDPHITCTMWEKSDHDTLHQLVQDRFTVENFGVKLCAETLKSPAIKSQAATILMTRRKYMILNIIRRDSTLGGEGEKRSKHIIGRSTWSGI